MAYNLLDLTSSVLDDLKDPNFSTTRIRRYLNYGQQVIFNTHSFRFCETSVAGSLTIGDYTYAQQDDHEMTIGGSVSDPDNTNVRFTLDEDSYLASREFFDRYPDPSANTAGLPTAWTEFGNQVYFDRPADIQYTFQQRYYRTPTDMSADADVPDVPIAFRELLELYADFRSEKFRGNHDIAATYEQMFEDGLEAMALKYAGTVWTGPVKMRSKRIRIA